MSKNKNNLYLLTSQSNEPKTLKTKLIAIEQ